jgi:hypothetical protein
VSAAILLGLQLDAAADPVVYDGTLVSGVTTPGEIGQNPEAGPQDPEYADYWLFWATAGDNVTVTVRRVDGELDPVLFVYDKDFVYTTGLGLSGGTDHLRDGTHLIGWVDDSLPPAVPGPWRDADFSFTAYVTGWHTAAVAEYASWSLPADGDYDYTIRVDGATRQRGGGSSVPEPALLAFLACGICGVALSRRRKSA